MLKRAPRDILLTRWTPWRGGGGGGGGGRLGGREGTAGGRGGENRQRNGQGRTGEDDDDIPMSSSFHVAHTSKPMFSRLTCPLISLMVLDFPSDDVHSQEVLMMPVPSGPKQTDLLICYCTRYRHLINFSCQVFQRGTFPFLRTLA